MVEAALRTAPALQRSGRRSSRRIGSVSSRRAEPAVASETPPLRVLLVTEGTYPFHFGGVSTWCHGLMRSLPEVKFSLLSIIDAPERPLRFVLPDNVVEFRTTPLWGVRGQGDLVGPAGSAELRQRQRAVTDAAVEAELVPLVCSFVEMLMVDEADPDELADIIVGLYRFFGGHDFDQAMRSRPVWQAFTEQASRRFGALAVSHGYRRAPLSLSDLTEGMHLVRAWLAPLAQRLPGVDVAHAAMNGMCTLVAVAAKRDQGAGFMLTEHGIFLREQYLAEAGRTGSLFVKLIRLRFALRTTELGYALADRVAPCCDSHQRWELRVGATPERVSTIYYGVDPTVFRPEPKSVEAPPTVVWVGRIDPLKDVETLLRAAAVVHRSRPDIVFRVYGAALPGNEDYRDRCMALRAELGLDNVVLMEGYTSSPSAAFNQGDLVALSSISEGFPYSTLEAMLCSKAVVATAVGGIAEQIRNCGELVEPRNPEQMGAAILRLMADPDALAELGDKARRQAKELFSQERERRAHLNAYSQMTGRMFDLSPEDVEPLAEHGWGRGRGKPGFQRMQKAGHLTAVLTTGTRRWQILSPCQDLEGDLRLAADATEAGDLLAAEDAALIAAVLHCGWNTSDTTNGVGHGAGQQNATPVSADDAPTPEAHELGDKPLAPLVAEARSRIAIPVHSYEVAAVLESCGVTDEVARRHGASDVFELAELVLAELRAEANPLALAGHEPPPTPLATSRSRSWLHWLGMAVPSAAFLASAQYLRHVGDVSARHASVLLIGLLAGAFVSTVLLQGLAPRAALYIGCGNLRFARRLAQSFTALAAGGVALMTGVGLLVALIAGWGTGNERLLAAAGFAAAAALWLAACGLVITQALHQLGAIVLAAVGVTVVIDRLTVPLTDQHARLAVVAGYALALLTVILRSVQRLAGPDTGPVAIGPPPLRRMVWEGAPYALQAALVLGMLLIPHVVVWAHPDLSGAGGRFSAVELALNLPLIPLLTASARIERTAGLYWREARRAQMETPAGRPEQFAVGLTTFFRAQRRAHCGYLLGASAALAIVFELALRFDWLGGLVPATYERDARPVLLAAIVGCFLVGVAIFDGAAATKLGSTAAVGRALATATVVSGGTALAVGAWGGPVAAPLALIAGAAVAVALCRRQLRRAVRHADHRYSTVV